MILAATSSGDSDNGWTTTHPIMVWARAFGTTRDAERAAAANAVSKILHRLEDRKLIERTLSGRERRIRVGLRCEDGSGDPYIVRTVRAQVTDRMLIANDRHLHRTLQRYVTTTGGARIGRCGCNRHPPTGPSST
jgi:hypothetical protein